SKEPDVSHLATRNDSSCNLYDAPSVTFATDTAGDERYTVVVGTKSDVLDQDNREISIDEAIEFAREINNDIDISKLDGDPYFETSAKTGYNVAKVFDYMFQYCLPEAQKSDKLSDGSTINLSEGAQTRSRPANKL
ncbi:hypothetical protein MAR_031528, partial [Mya arenaria]